MNADRAPGTIVVTGGGFLRFEACWQMRWMSLYSEQFRDRSAALRHNWNRPALRVGPLRVQWNIEMAEHGGSQVRRRDPPAARLAATRVGAADDLAMP